LSDRAALALAAALWILPASAQTAGSVEGQVVNLKTGAALRGATVTLTGPYAQRVLLPYCCPKTPPRVQAMADERGGFAFRGVEPGNYSLTAARDGYSTGYYGRIGGAQELLSVGQDRPAKGIVIKLAPRGVIAGKVVDEAGQPLQNARITLYRYLYGAWVRYAGSPSDPFAYTNDLGEYRVFDILPGQYVMSAAYPYAAALLEAQATPGVGHKTTYFPDSPGPRGAQPLAVASGETAKADFTLRKGPVFRIRGVVADADPAPRRQTCVGLVPEGARPSGFLMVGSIGTIMQNASFEIIAVPPGQYTLTATCTSDGGQPAGAMQALNVAGDVEGVTIAATPARKLRGTVRVRGKADLSGAIVVLQSVEPFGGPLLSVPLPSRGAFALDGVLPSRYVPEIRRLPPNCYIRSIRYGGKEVPAAGFRVRPDASLEITVSALSPARLSGLVLDSAGQPVKYPTVTVISSSGSPAASDTFIVGDERGRFTFRALRPGLYKAAAWEEFLPLPLIEAGDSRLLKLFEARAKTVRLAHEMPRDVRLRLITTEEASRARAGQ
jgi:protocatechuate 3,4-dioxygenase beta subunit